MIPEPSPPFRQSRLFRMFLLLICLVIIFLGIAYIPLIVPLIDWTWTGFSKRTLWDWMSLLIVPVVLAIVGVAFNIAITRNTRNIAIDNQQENLLQSYLDRMAELLIDKHLQDSPEPVELRSIARARTLSVLAKLDPKRKARLLQFLYEAKLIGKDKRIIDLREADLSRADLRNIDLSEANLTEVDLRNALLRKSILRDVVLSGSDLSEADLSGAKLEGADLSRVRLVKTKLRKAKLPEFNLSGANLLDTDLSEADLSGANLSGAIANFWDIDDRAPEYGISVNLRKAKLNRADLSRAYLWGADLQEADLSGADFSEATLTHAKLKGAITKDTSFKDTHLDEDALTDKQKKEAKFVRT